MVPLAAIFLKEKIGLRRTIAALVGFTGVLIMLDPGGDYNFASFMALGAAIAFAFAAILVNIVSKYDEPVTLMFYSNIISVLIMIIPALIGMGLSTKVRSKINEVSFRRLFFISLSTIGVWIVTSAVMNLK